MNAVYEVIETEIQNGRGAMLQEDLAESPGVLGSEVRELRLGITPKQDRVLSIMGAYKTEGAREGGRYVVYFGGKQAITFCE